jgi:all-trans-retinol dehydrogenase (NAD+)
VHYYKCDITSTSQLASVAEQIRSQVGNPTVLINNAGVARGKTILGASERDIRFTFDVNTLAHYWIVKQFLPAMVDANHGMMVTVASYASYMTVPAMVDYAASKHAALAFHEGLTAELTTQYKAPKVRTVVVMQGYTKTALFTGYEQDTQFLLPALEPETVAETIVKQVLKGKSGHIIIPAFGGLLAALQAFPLWYQVFVRAKYQTLMANFNGRQVVKDLDKFYADKEKEQVKSDAGESAVLVSQPSEA